MTRLDDLVIEEQHFRTAEATSLPASVQREQYLSFARMYLDNNAYFSAMRTLANASKLCGKADCEEKYDINRSIVYIGAQFLLKQLAAEQDGRETVQHWMIRDVQKNVALSSLRVAELSLFLETRPKYSFIEAFKTLLQLERQIHLDPSDPKDEGYLATRRHIVETYVQQQLSTIFDRMHTERQQGSIRTLSRLCQVRDAMKRWHVESMPGNFSQNLFARYERALKIARRDHAQNHA